MSSPATTKVNLGGDVLPAIDADVVFSTMVMTPPISPCAAPFAGVPPPTFYPAIFSNSPTTPTSAETALVPVGTYYPPMMPFEQNGAYYSPMPYQYPIPNINGAYGHVPFFYPDAYYPAYPESVMQEVAPGMPATADLGNEGQ